MSARFRGGFLVAVAAACAASVIASAAKSAAAAAISRDGSQSISHPQTPAARFGKFPRRLIPAARRVFDTRATDQLTGLWHKPTPRIIGGSSAAQGSFGYMATVLYFDTTGNPEFLCSGTLVSSNVVLTAGHCGADETTGAPNAPSGYRIVTNSVDWTNPAERVISDVSQVDVDSNFDPSSLFGDAAMLILSSPVSSPTIPLWGSGQLRAGTGAAIAGWGRTYAGQTAVQAALQWAPTVVQSINYCANRAGGGYAYDSGTELCVANGPYNDTATCNGDSGGPLLATASNGTEMEIGITSAGPTNCNTDTADFFTAVLPIEPWIASEVSAAAPTTAPTAPTAAQPPELPRMSRAFARSHTRRVLTGVFHRAFTRGHSYKVSCSRVAAPRFNCAANFSSGPNDYYGNVIVYYTFGAKNVVYWSDRYTMRWVNDYCYFRSGHRRACRIRVRRGVF